MLKIVWTSLNSYCN